MNGKQDLRSRLVVGRKRDGRREYDELARTDLVQICLKPAVSIARTAMEHDLNPNLLRTWVARYQKARGEPDLRLAQVDGQRGEGLLLDATPTQAMVVAEASSPIPAFVPVVSLPQARPSPPSLQPPEMRIGLWVRLPNGVELELGKTNLQEMATLVQMLGRLPCSGSTKG